MLEVEGLTFSYGDRFALEDVTFTVAPGSVTALLGPNGAGKTTLFALITRLFDSGIGAVRIGGHDLRRDPLPALACLGIVFQQPTLDLDLTVAQNLRYFASLQGLSRRDAEERIGTELARLDMKEYRNSRVRKLSGGYRRRTEVARALLHRPSLLLLDEPTVGLDVPTRRRIVEHVHALADTEGIAVLWATHLIDEVWDDDHLIVLHRGRIRAAGPVAEVNHAAGCKSLDATFERLTAEAPASEGPA